MKNLLLTVAIVMMAGTALPAFALTVSPVRIEVTGDPGTTLKGEIELFNEQSDQSGEKTFYTTFENFEPSGDTGAPRFIGAKDGLATWIKSETKVVLDSGVRTLVPYSITIPKNAEPGGHFAAIFFGTEDPSALREGQVSVGGKIGVLVLLRVSGEIAEGGGLLDFKVKDGQKFFTVLPVSFVYRVNNTGGDRVVPKGNIEVKNLGLFNSATLLANKNDGSILPDSTRKFEVMWGIETQPANNVKEDKDSSGFFAMAKKEWREIHFGWYTAKLDISWGMTNQTASASYSFFVFPWQLLIIMLVVFLVLVFLGRIAIKKYNRWIIAKARLK